MTAFLVMSVPVVGSIKIAVGISRNRPVGYLMLLVILTAVAGAVLLSKGPHRTHRGSRLLKKLRDDYSEYSSRSEHSDRDPTVLLIALFGFSALTGEAAKLRSFFAPVPTTSSSGCGSSCGGGGCGGGGCGGGCGGCGG